VILEVDGMEFGYRSISVLRNIKFSLGRSETLSILGPNGVGKTTLLKCINRIIHARSGTVMVEDEDVASMSRTEMARKMGYVPQRGEVSRITVFDAVLLGRRPYIKWDVTKEDIEIANQAVEELGLSSMSLRYIDEISGGEYQKVQIARALVQQPKVLLLDEPTSALDLCNQHVMMKKMVDLVKRNGLTAVMTMHDLNLALRYSDRFILLKDGTVYAAGGREIMTPANIEAVYGLPVLVQSIEGLPVVVPV
jgi:iron complex transport system ATP-binding protein